MNHPLVSISCITYNHAPYIRECLHGFMMQKCDFDFEVLIHDDASTDGTQEIIREYQEKYPEIIKPILQKENQWSQGVRGINLKFNFSRAKGKYIALCEGDDYWTDPLKLQKQVDFLEKNEEFGLVCTHCHTSEEKRKPLISDTEITAFEILHHNPIYTLTTLFRKSIIKDIKTTPTFKMGDYPLWLEIVKKCRIMKLRDNTAIYRVLEISASGRNDIDKRIDFVKDSFNVTLKYIDDFSLSQSQKRKIINSRLSVLLATIQKKSKWMQFRFLIEFFIERKYFSFNLSYQVLRSFLYY